MGSYNFVHYHAFVNCIYFLYLVQIIDFFLLIELPTILSAVWRETKQIRKYQGDYLVKKKEKKILMSGSILIIILSRHIDGQKCCRVTCIMKTWLHT